MSLQTGDGNGTVIHRNDRSGFPSPPHTVSGGRLCCRCRCNYTGGSRSIAAGPAVRALSPYRDARVALVAPITGDVIPRHTLARPPGTAEYRRLRAVEPG